MKMSNCSSFLLLTTARYAFLSLKAKKGVSAISTFFVVEGGSFPLCLGMSLMASRGFGGRQCAYKKSAVLFSFRHYRLLVSGAITAKVSIWMPLSFKLLKHCSSVSSIL